MRGCQSGNLFWSLKISTEWRPSICSSLKSSISSSSFWRFSTSDLWVLSSSASALWRCSISNSCSLKSSFSAAFFAIHWFSKFVFYFLSLPSLFSCSSVARSAGFALRPLLWGLRWLSQAVFILENSVSFSPWFLSSVPSWSWSTVLHIFSHFTLIVPHWTQGLFENTNSWNTQTLLNHSLLRTCSIICMPSTLLPSRIAVMHWHSTL